jgi:hypothetical protein
MKIKLILLLVFVISNKCLSQLKIFSGETIMVYNSDVLYSNEDIVNNGSITLVNSKLCVGGNLDNSGTLTMSNGTLNVTGNNTQVFNFGASDVTKRLELDKSSGVATINSGNLTVIDRLLSTQGTLNGGGKLILRSTAVKTAIVEQSAGGAVDNVVVERYIPSKRAFRLISSPVTTSSSIKYNWQENQNNTSTAFANNTNTTPGYGTHITGSTVGVNGFDATQTGAASLFSYNNATQAWAGISNTNTNTLAAGEAYRLMVRGSRSVDLTNNAATSSSTTLRTTGSLKIGTFTNSNLSQVANGYNFVGNPYQSPVNISGVLNSSTNLNTNFYYVWDPKVGGNNGRGAYVTYSFSGNTNNVSGSAVNQYLQPMQACFVKTLANGVASITFNESNKYTTATNENVYKNTSYQDNFSSLRLTLYEADAFSQQQTPADGALLFFNDSYSNALDVNDAGKMTNLDENLSVLVDNSRLSIGSFQTPQINSIYPLNIDQYRYTNYTLVAQTENNTGLIPYLHDKFTATISEINSTLNYNFSIDTNNNLSIASNRFEIIYSSTILANDSFNEQNIVLYPNPSNTNDFNIQLPIGTSDYSIKVYNSLGQLLDVNLIETGTNILKCKVSSDIVSGIYQVVITKDNASVVKKWIKN